MSAATRTAPLTAARTVRGVTLSVSLDRVDAEGFAMWRWTVADASGVLDTGADLSTGAWKPDAGRAVRELLLFAASAADPYSGWDGDAFNPAALAAMAPIADDLCLAGLGAGA